MSRRGHCVLLLAGCCVWPMATTGLLLKPYSLHGLSPSTAFGKVFFPMESSSALSARLGANETGTSALLFSTSSSSMNEGRRATTSALSASVASEIAIDLDGVFEKEVLSLEERQEKLLEVALSLKELSTTTTSTTSSPATATENVRSDWTSVITAALLVTGNTVGAGALVLPELAAKPGFSLSTSMFCVAYLVNLLSGLLLCEVAILQHSARSSEDSPPSSFRDFATRSLEDPSIANGISAVSLFVNTCALTFSLGRGGVIGADVLTQIVPADMMMVDHVALSVVFAGLLAIMASTQSRVQISQISSVFVTALFASVAALIIPGLVNLQDPVATLWAPGTATSTAGHGNVMTSMLEVAPIMLTTLIFQNIVPSVTRILNYDRTKSVMALVLGSFLPLLLYVSWSFVVLGGGVDTSTGVMTPLLMTIFSVAAVTGSAIGCTMAVSEELETFFGGAQEDVSNARELATSDATTSTDAGFALPAVLVAVAVPLLCSTLCHEYTDALKLSGGYGIPILYGAIPVLMLSTQRRKTTDLVDDPPQQELIPGGSASLGLVVTAFGGFMLNSIVGDANHFLAAASV